MHQRYGAISVILASLLFPASSFSAETKLVKAVSPHFELYTTDNDAAAKDAITHFETVRGYLLKSFHTDDPFAAPVRIVTFKSDGEYGPYVPRNADPAAKAFATDKPPRVTIVISSAKKEAYQYGAREYVSMMLARVAPKMPYWLRLGFSELYCTLRLDNGTLVMGSSPAREFHSAISMDFNMETMFALKGGEDRYKGAADFYAQPGTDTLGRSSFGGSTMATLESTLGVDYPAILWQLTHMLMFQKPYSQKFGAFVSAVAGGGDTAVAVQQVLGQSLVGLKEDLALYIKMPAHAVTRLTYKLDEPMAPQVSQLNPAESALILADLKAAK